MTVRTVSRAATHGETVRCLFAIELSKQSWVIGFILNPAVARCYLAATRWFFNLWVHRSGFTPLPSGAAERAVDAP
jgi:hypothetical protein